VPLRWDPGVLRSANGDQPARMHCVPSGPLSAAENVVCACFGVGLEAIQDALASGKARSVFDIGRVLRAGSNCGSCVPEIRKLIRHECRTTQAAGSAAAPIGKKLPAAPRASR
jgi:NAD(P)H-nitrite reductase large subunit